MSLISFEIRFSTMRWFWANITVHGFARSEFVILVGFGDFLGLINKIDEEIANKLNQV